MNLAWAAISWPWSHVNVRVNAAGRVVIFAGKLTVEETIVEVSTENSPTGQRMLTKPYPKDNEPGTWASTRSPCPDRRVIAGRRLKPGDLLFATRDGTPISRNTFRTRVWRPAVAASGIDFHVRVHDLRHAHASWLLAGGSDLKSVMDRMGHAQITTTQKYLHTLPDADAKNLTALDRIRTLAPARDRSQPAEDQDWPPPRCRETWRRAAMNPSPSPATSSSALTGREWTPSSTPNRTGRSANARALRPEPVAELRRQADQIRPHAFSHSKRRRPEVSRDLGGSRRNEP